MVSLILTKKTHFRMDNLHPSGNDVSAQTGFQSPKPVSSRWVDLRSRSFNFSNTPDGCIYSGQAVELHFSPKHKEVRGCNHFETKYIFAGARAVTHLAAVKSKRFCCRKSPGTDSKKRSASSKRGATAFAPRVRSWLFSRKGFFTRN
ncbi:hypothetical protein TRIP_B200728 [uncultured Desulfatiglans sp.]|uniref:Uncharacterized protein n=1 Tax=Uncultured Desulfatiglans sp. TaxID=1748965 RepID=A0A653A3R1_UNCDX|nr:hypothetical protein TRIP_B200728 [uncultured Desulfatiglans sp.]